MKLKTEVTRIPPAPSKDASAHQEITEERLAAYPADTLFVVYCAGPHCNGANKAAVHIARIGRPVKEMIGGIVGWRGEGYELVKGA